MKRLLVCFGLLMASGVFGGQEERDSLRLIGHEPSVVVAPQQDPAPAAPTPTEEQAFTSENRERAEDLSRAIGQAEDAGDIDRLLQLVVEARNASTAVEAGGNSRFGTSGEFHHRFIDLARMAAQGAQRLLQGPEDDFSLNGNQQPPMPPAGGLGEE